MPRPEPLSESIFAAFEFIPDPRAPNRRYRLDSILFIALVGTLCGADGFVQIERVARAKRQLIAKFVELPGDEIPTHDTIARLFSLLSPADFRAAFISFISVITKKPKADVVALDGKTLRGAVSKRKLEGAAEEDVTHIVSAFSTKRAAVLGQIRSAAYRNESDAARQLLELLDVKGTVVTMDAAHCFAETIDLAVERGADVVVALKDNQPRLREFAEKAFPRRKGQKPHIEEDEAHGRRERRVYETIDVADDVLDLRWTSVRSITRVERERTSLTTWDRSTTTHFYLSTLPARELVRISSAIRSHWQIENQVHWRLDVQFDEDHCRVRIGNAAENLSRVRHIALALLSADKTEKVGVAMRRIVAAMDDNYLMRLLTPSTT